MHIRICYLKEEATHIIRTMKVLFLCLVVVALSSACIQPQICTVACAPCPATHPLAGCVGATCKCSPAPCRPEDCPDTCFLGARVCTGTTADFSCKCVQVTDLQIAGRRRRHTDA